MSLKQLGMLAIGIPMFWFPEPVSTIIGATLVLAAFGLEDEAPVGGGA